MVIRAAVVKDAKEIVKTAVVVDAQRIVVADVKVDVQAVAHILPPMNNIVNYAII